MLRVALLGMGRTAVYLKTKINGTCTNGLSEVYWHGFMFFMWLDCSSLNPWFGEGRKKALQQKDIDIYCMGRELCHMFCMLRPHNQIVSKNKMKSKMDTGTRSFCGTDLWTSFQSKQYSQ